MDDDDLLDDLGSGPTLLTRDGNKLVVVFDDLQDEEGKREFPDPPKYGGVEIKEEVPEPDGLSLETFQR